MNFSSKNQMINKPQVGMGHIVTKKKRLTTKVQDNKVPVYVADLKMTIMVLPGADVDAIVQRYKDQREWQRKSLHC